MTNKIERRKFIGTSAKGVAAIGLLTASSCTTEGSKELGKNFVHHVFFWLKKPVTPEARAKFEKALQSLKTIELIIDCHIGIPGGTIGDVIDDTYSYSLLCTYKNKDDQGTYEKHPTHLKFIEDCQDLWERVVVYDTVSI